MTDMPKDANRLESLILTVIFATVSAGLLAVLTLATRPGPDSAGWWTRPPLAPAVALSVLVLANVLTLWKEIAALRRAPPRPEEWDGLRAGLRGWLRPLEFLAYFTAYLWVLKWIGYFPATLIFVTGLLLRVGLRTPRWLMIGALTALALTLIFRMGLGVWMPASPLYDLLPGALRTAALRWF